jgi:hypothetical protein
MDRLVFRMTSENLAALLAKRVMGWGVGPDRFLLSGRGWMPRWRFQPTENLDDAFKLLDKAAPDEFVLASDGKGYSVRVRIGAITGESRDLSRPRAITMALALALGLEVTL